MKQHSTPFICSSCETQLRSLTAGRSMRCEHIGVRIDIDGKGKRKFRFDDGRGPMFTTDRETRQTGRDS